MQLKNEKTNLLLINPEEMNQVDKIAMQYLPVLTLMENAGLAVARAIMQFYKPCKILVLCGPGNNGGDGYVVAHILANEGWPVKVASLKPPEKGTDAYKAFVQWNGDKTDFNIQSVRDADLVVDAVFGAGLSRDIDDHISSVLNAADHLVAIDMPSGVDGKTGIIRGYAPHAELTVTFCRAKAGHYLLPGREYIGKLVIANIGIPENILSELSINTWLNEPGLWELPIADVEDYKYHRGIVNVVGGGTVTGAARLSALAASSCGAGLVHIFAFSSRDLYLLTSPCFMVDEGDFTDTLQDKRRKVWVCGPGLTEDEVKISLTNLIKTNKTIVADASALTKENFDLLKQCAVITPHIGEFKRIFGDFKDCRIEAVKKAASILNTVVILKGPDTLIASPDGRVAVNCHANARLATAGSGDVLTGVIATLLACGMEVWEASCAAVWIHGEAAFLHNNSWPDAMDLIHNLGKARDNGRYHVEK
ncbi:MAG: NAD(P)H-hydrate dehydratase [Commensalibacter sp.]|nr:NAD(P)H-hydrate dehydratase [Commensalibacter sp.]